MRRYLIDTHILVWLAEEPARLPASIIADLGDMKNVVYVSAATFWEIAMNRNRGRMKFGKSIADELEGLSFLELPVSGAHFEAAVGLPQIHKDPFDRLLVAQALAEGLTLVTHDKLLAAYNVPMIRV